MPLGIVTMGALGLAGDFLSSHSQRRANRTNVKLQREQQAWEERMSNTAMQRRVSDVVAAGGNPATVFEGGASASTPTISPAKVEADIKPGQFDAMSKLAMMQDLANMKAQNALTVAQTAKTKAEEDFLRGPRTTSTETGIQSSLQGIRESEARISKITADIGEIIGRTQGIELENQLKGKSIDTQVDLIKAHVREALANAKLRENFSQIADHYMKIFEGVKNMGGASSTFINDAIDEVTEMIEAAKRNFNNFYSPSKPTPRTNNNPNRRKY